MFSLALRLFGGADVSFGGKTGSIASAFETKLTTRKRTSPWAFERLALSKAAWPHLRQVEQLRRQFGDFRIEWSRLQTYPLAQAGN